MATVKIQGSASGTGSVTLIAPNTNSNRVLTLPDEDGTVGGSTKAWVNFNGSLTIAIRSSKNVSSLTDYATGTYAINYSSALADANYAPSGQTQAINTGDHGTVTLDAANQSAAPTLMSTTAYRFRTGIARVGNYDMATISIIVAR